jgi:flagellin-like hook-associated protein FlgL
MKKTMRKTMKRKLRGGAEAAPNSTEKAVNNGYIDRLKKNVSGKVAGLVNRLVTKQIEGRMLRCLPPEVKEDVQTNIEGTTHDMVQDITSKMLDTGMNIVKATPAVGNAVSALSAVDNVIAGIKNAKANVVKIQDEINSVQNQVQNVAAAATNVNANANFNNMVPQIGGGANKLQTILERAHHSIAQHHGDVHQNQPQKGGQIVTNNFQTIMERSGHSVAQHHGDLIHSVILNRTKKTIDNFHKSTKKLQR